MVAGAAAAVAFTQSGNELLSRLMRRLHPEGKHLARRHQTARPARRSRRRPNAIAKRLICAAIAEMIAADTMRMMPLGAITSSPCLDKRTHCQRDRNEHIRPHLSPLDTDWFAASQDYQTTGTCWIISGVEGSDIYFYFLSAIHQDV